MGGAMKHFDPNATIQLDRVDRLDDVQLDDIDAPANGIATKSNAPRVSGRPQTSSGPPPLPPSASLPPSALLPPSASLSPSASYAPLPPRDVPQKKAASKGKTVVQAVLFAALLGAAIVGGLKMGSSLRAAPPPAKAAAPIVVQTPPAPSASVAEPAAPAVITMPTIEMSYPPAESK